MNKTYDLDFIKTISKNFQRLFSRYPGEDVAMVTPARELDTARFTHVKPFAITNLIIQHWLMFSI